MKKHFLTFIFSFYLIFSFCQPFYSKVTTPPQFLSSFALENMEIKNDTIIFNSYPVEEIDGELYANTYLTKYTKQGHLISATKIGVESKRSKIFMDNENIYTLGTFKESTRDSLQIFLVKGGHAIQKFEFFNPYGYLSLGSHYKFLKYKTQYLVFCSGVYFYLNKDKEYKPYIIWIDHDFTLDSVMRLDLPYGELFDFGIDDDGHLNILAQYHSDRQIAGPNMTQNYQGYIKLDESKKIIHSYFEEQKHIKYPFTKDPQGIFYPDGTKIMTGPFGEKLRIISMDKNENILWQDSTYLDQNLKYNEHVSYAKCHNGDILILATNFHKSGLSDSKDQFETSFIQRYDKNGNEKFFRSYGYYNKTYGKSEGNWLYDIKEKNSNNIIAIGGIASRDPHTTYPGLFNDSTWILSVDSMGCIDKDKCNDVIAWNAPNNLHQYDQINVRHKEWYISSDKGRYVQTFGRDTNMFHRPAYGWLRYRPIMTKSLDTGVETKDTVFTTWAPEGRMFISPRNFNPFAALPIYALYDFTLSLHDTFTLPYGFGQAKVDQVDSISLIPGYVRKRIILKHLNPTNQAKYGDLVWIEGIGSPNGLLYYKDWQEGTKTALTCYYDRGEKRYSSNDDSDCRKPALIKPEFTSYGPYCLGSTADVLPAKSINTPSISGKWIPDLINTTSVGTFKYIFIPDEDQNADTTSIFVHIIDKVTPVFNIKDNYLINDTPQNLPNVSENGIEGIWSPSTINTQILGSSTYTFTPIKNSCALIYIKDINVSFLIDTTDMDCSTIWYSSSYIGSWAEGDCRKKIDITKVVRDTLIGDRLCRIIGVTSGGQYFPESEIIEFGKDGKLYFYEDNNWKLLYDFAARVGDTVTYFVSKKYPYYEKLSVPSPFEQDIIDGNPYRLVINSVDTTYDAAGNHLKRFHTQNVDNTTVHTMGIIIENVGSIHKVFGSNTIFVGPDCTETEWTGLRCYTDKNTFVKFVSSKCDELTSVNNVENVNKITIYPNPGNDQVTILMPTEVSLPVRYQITDVSRRMIEMGSQNQDHWTQATDHLMPGCYIISILDAKGRHWANKWVKE